MLRTNGVSTEKRNQHQGGLPERRDQRTEPRWWLHRVSGSSKTSKGKDTGRFS
eukprot:jgi/Psemu1/61818/gm1.61818_g